MLWYFFLFGKSCTCGWDIIFPWVCLYELQPVPLPRKRCQCKATLCKFCLGSYMLHVIGLNVFQKCIKWWDCHLLHMIFSLLFFQKVAFMLFLFSVSFKIVVTLSVHSPVCIYVTHIQNRRQWPLCWGSFQWELIQKSETGLRKLCFLLSFSLETDNSTAPAQWSCCLVYLILLVTFHISVKSPKPLNPLGIRMQHWK